MTTVVITQPMLFPWPGFFEQLSLADVYIYLDDAQFSKGSFTNRVQILDREKVRWLTIPLHQKGSFQRICDLVPADDRWPERHREMLERSLRGAPYLSEALSLLDRAYHAPDLATTLIDSVELSARYLGVGAGRRILRSSRMGIEGQSWERVLELVKAAGGTCYLTGHGAARYLDHHAFEAGGVTVDYMAYSLREWPRSELSRTPYLSVLDLIAWTGPAAALHLQPGIMPWRDFVQPALR